MTQFFARRRVVLGFAAGAIALWLARPTPRTLAIGAVIALAGELLRVWAAGHLEKSREVTTSGPYRWMRHPLYVGSTIMGLGLAVASNSLIVSGLVAAYVVVSIGAAVRAEEAHLTEKFGRAYPAYRRGQGPYVSRRFSLTRVARNREYRALAGLAVALGLLAWKAW